MPYQSLPRDPVTTGVNGW